MTPNVHVYTACLGSTDTLKDPSIVGPGVRYLCASDRPIKSKVWQHIPVKVEGDPVFAARRFKIMLHEHAKQADYYLWTDASFRLDVDPRIFAPKLMRNDVLVLEHLDRNPRTIEEEANALVRRLPIPLDKLLGQASRYRELGFPTDFGMSITGLLVRRNSKRVMRFNRLWWEELTANEHTRDQMSFDFCIWKCGLDKEFLEGHYQKGNPYAKFVKEYKCQRS